MAFVGGKIRIFKNFRPNFHFGDHSALRFWLFELWQALAWEWLGLEVGSRVAMTLQRRDGIKINCHEVVISQCVHFLRTFLVTPQRLTSNLLPKIKKRWSITLKRKIDGPNVYLQTGIVKRHSIFAVNTYCCCCCWCSCCLTIFRIKERWWELCDGPTDRQT